MRGPFVNIASVIAIALCAMSAIAQSDSPITVLWPTQDQPTLKLTFDKFVQSGLVNGQGIYVSDVTAQNVSAQGMPRSMFTVFISDKNGVRIGRAILKMAEIPAYRTQKSQIQFSAAGTPAAVALLAGKTIPLRVLSVPPGAAFKVDGEDAGVAPKVIDFTIGTHALEFSKAGYATGSMQLDVGADELPGGSVSFELGGLSQDSIELRDGTTLLGDVISVSLTDVLVRVDGKDQKLTRNQVKKITLVEREFSENPAPKDTTPTKKTP